MQTKTSDLPASNNDADYEYYLEQLRKKRAKAEKLKAQLSQNVTTVQMEKEEETDESKRAITREMEKSKGHVLSKKKKIDRNPRVKLREKFRKKKIARKGQVREVRKPTHRYDGEYSGIR